jgi:OOP family OmpA-OmpF porin
MGRIVVVFALLGMNFTSYAQQRVVLDTVCFNTAANDFGLRLVGNQWIMVSDAFPDQKGKVPIDEVTMRPFTDLVEVDNCTSKDMQLMNKKYDQIVTINSSLNDGPVSMSDDGQLFFFTNNSSSKKNKLGIFYSIKEEGKWIQPLAYPLNNDAYNVTHPYFDSQSKRLYFASNFEKGGKNYDLYYSDYDGKNWGRPVSIPGVNTDSAEVFPMIYNGTLYYTSNQPGKGGYDLYKLTESGSVSLGDPYNSEYDDISIFVLNDTIGYFSSNRASNGQHDDVFKFRIETPKPPVVVDVPPPPPLEKKKFKMENIAFQFDSYAVTEDQKKYLNEVATKLNERKDVYMVVIGHADNVGAAAYNKVLSKKRAEAVKSYLVTQGVESGRILVESYGFERPLESNTTPEGRAKNRRVEFKFLGEIEL